MLTGFFLLLNAKQTKKAQSRKCTRANMFLSEANICNNKELERMKIIFKMFYVTYAILDVESD